MNSLSKMYNQTNQYVKKDIILQIKMESVPVKLVMIGDGAVGKTSMLCSYKQGRFPHEYTPTIFENSATSLKVKNRLVTLGLWDTAGQQQFAKLRPLAYTNVDVFLITFSVADRSSFHNVFKKWIPEVKAVNPKAVVVIVGNKIDLRGRGIYSLEVSAEEARREATKYRYLYWECSALTRQGLTQAFECAVRQVLSIINIGHRQTQNSDPTCPSCGGCNLM